MSWSKLPKAASRIFKKDDACAAAWTENLIFPYFDAEALSLGVGGRGFTAKRSGDDAIKSGRIRSGHDFMYLNL